MNKSIFDEALADIKSIKELAENSAKEEILDSITPKIREMIEMELLKGASLEEEEEYNNLDEEEEESLSEFEGLEKPTLESKTVSKLSFSSLSSKPQNTQVTESICSDLINEVDKIKNSTVPSYKQIKSVLVKIEETRKLLETNTIDLKQVKIIESVLNDCFNKVKNIGSLKNESTLVLKNADKFLDPTDSTEYIIDLQQMQQQENEKKQNNTWRNEMNFNELNENTLLEIDENELQEALAEMAQEEMEEGSYMSEEEMNLEMPEGDEEMEMGPEMEEEGEEEMEMSPEEQAQELLDGLDPEVRAALENLLGAPAVEMEAEVAMPAGEEMEEEMPSPAAPAMESRFNYYKNLYMEAKSGSKEETKYLNILRDIATKMPASQKQKLIKEGSSNRSLTSEAALRQELAESNLLNTKLLYTNRLLQNDSLTNRQKAKIIEKIDEARSDREVKLVFESINRLVSESREQRSSNVSRVIGSSSTPTRRSSAETLNENHEAQRWAKLAGILK
jgi:hypothetical protein